jgi:hypothetical protein
MSLIPKGRREKVSLTEVANQNLVDAETQWFMAEMALYSAAVDPSEGADSRPVLRW